jgi:hypothetical protein
MSGVFSKTVSVNSTHVLTLWYDTWPPFTFTQAGIILEITVEAFRDVLLMIAELVVNAVSIYCLKEYFKKRSILIFNITRAVNDEMALEQMNATMPVTINQDRLELRETKNSSADLRATIMSIVMCSLSVLEHIFVWLDV